VGCLPSILTFVSIQATLKRTMPIEVSSIGIGLLMQLHLPLLELF
jgi:hypothetical protein